MAYVPPHKRSQARQTIGRSNDKQNDSTSRVWSKTFASQTSLKEHLKQPSLESNGQLSRFFDQITFYHCINLSERRDKWRNFQKRATYVNSKFARLIKRFNAVNGTQVLSEGHLDDNYIRLEWDSSTNAMYSPKILPGPKTMGAGEVGCALSHVALWKMLASTKTEAETDNIVMMVLEDDAVFSSVEHKNGFTMVLSQAMEKLPSHWDMLYLGFSSRGERKYLERKTLTKNSPELDCDVELYRPEYGYHTHAYLITRRAALTLMGNLPVQGPVDVWLADNKWFNLEVFCAVIANKGWKREDGTYEGQVLVRQDRHHGIQSDIKQSCHSFKDSTDTTSAQVYSRSDILQNND